MMGGGVLLFVQQLLFSNLKRKNKMPIPHIDDYKEKKEKSHASWYILAIVIGITIFYFLLGSTKLIILIVGFAIGNWIYFGIGVLILLILIKKLKKRKRKKEFREYEDRYR